jgi:hypothetical protein
MDTRQLSMPNTRFVASNTGYASCKTKYAIAETGEWPVDRATSIVLSGPNLSLADLRWLVARCEEFSPASTVQICAPRDSDQAGYEQIVVHPQPRSRERRSEGPATG